MNWRKQKDAEDSIPPEILDPCFSAFKTSPTYRRVAPHEKPGRTYLPFALHPV